MALATGINFAKTRTVKPFAQKQNEKTTKEEKIWQ